MNIEPPRWQATISTGPELDVVIFDFESACGRARLSPAETRTLASVFAAGAEHVGRSDFQATLDNYTTRGRLIARVADPANWHKPSDPS
jgi:hypothetical protein